MLLAAEDHEVNGLFRLLLQSFDNRPTGCHWIEPCHPIFRQLTNSIVERETLRRTVSADQSVRRQGREQSVNGWAIQLHQFFDVENAQRRLLGRERLQDRDG